MAGVAEAPSPAAVAWDAPSRRSVEAPALRPSDVRQQRQEQLDGLVKVGGVRAAGPGLSDPEPYRCPMQHDELNRTAELDAGGSPCRPMGAYSRRDV